MSVIDPAAARALALGKQLEALADIDPTEWDVKQAYDAAMLLTEIADIAVDRCIDLEDANQNLKDDLARCRQAIKELRAQRDQARTKAADADAAYTELKLAAHTVQALSKRVQAENADLRSHIPVGTVCQSCGAFNRPEHGS